MTHGKRPDAIAETFRAAADGLVCESLGAGVREIVRCVGTNETPCTQAEILADMTGSTVTEAEWAINNYWSRNSIPDADDPSLRDRLTEVDEPIPGVDE